MNDKDQKEFAELMERRTNQAATEIIQVIKKADLQPLAAIVSIVKASAILMESYNAVGEDADFLEHVFKTTIGPARMEVREDMLPSVDMSKMKN